MASYDFTSRHVMLISDETRHYFTPKQGDAAGIFLQLQLLPATSDVRTLFCGSGWTNSAPLLLPLKREKSCCVSGKGKKCVFCVSTCFIPNHILTCSTHDPSNPTRVDEQSGRCSLLSAAPNVLWQNNCFTAIVAFQMFFNASYVKLSAASCGECFIYVLNPFSRQKSKHEAPLHSCVYTSLLKKVLQPPPPKP